jgi:hypothetical protein
MASFRKYLLRKNHMLIKRKLSEDPDKNILVGRNSGKGLR